MFSLKNSVQSIIRVVRKTLHLRNRWSNNKDRWE